MDKSATRAVHPAGLVTGLCRLESHKALAGRKCILHPNRSLRGRIPPALGFAYAVPMLSIDFLFTQPQLKTLIPPIRGLRNFRFVESLHHTISHKGTSGIVSPTEGLPAAESVPVEECIEFGHDLKGICSIEDVGFATRGVDHAGSNANNARARFLEPANKPPSSGSMNTGGDSGTVKRLPPRISRGGTGHERFVAPISTTPCGWI